MKVISRESAQEFFVVVKIRSNSTHTVLKNTFAPPSPRSKYEKQTLLVLESYGTSNSDSFGQKKFDNQLNYG